MLQWSDKFILGHERIDFQHHVFFGLVCDFQKARLEDADRARLANILAEISLYARFHFRSEENIMRDMHYPHLEEHQLEHYNLIEVLSNKILALELGHFSPEDIEAFLVHWFIEHTAHDDRKIVEYLKNKSETKEPVTVECLDREPARQ